MPFPDLNSFLFGLVCGCLASVLVGAFALFVFVRPFVQAAVRQRKPQ